MLPNVTGGVISYLKMVIEGLRTRLSCVKEVVARKPLEGTKDKFPMNKEPRARRGLKT